MKNLLLMSVMLVMISCGSSDGEGTNQQTDSTATENTNMDSLNVTEVKTVDELLDTLKSVPSEAVTK
jgi:hypothetical protein